MRLMLRIVLLFISGVAMASELPMTVAETTDYKSTSRYDDVISFVHAIQSIDPGIRLETFATTNEGRALPLVIVGPAGGADPRTPHPRAPPVLFIMAHTHPRE